VAQGSLKLDEGRRQAHVVLGLVFLHEVGYLDYSVEISDELELDLGVSPMG